jgi:hypothetical protein
MTDIYKQSIILQLIMTHAGCGYFQNHILTIEILINFIIINRFTLTFALLLVVESPSSLCQQLRDQISY